MGEQDGHGDGGYNSAQVEEDLLRHCLPSIVVCICLTRDSSFQSC